MIKISEHDHQKSLVHWAKLASGKYPQLKLLYAIPNAAKRSPKIAAMMKAEGLQSGVPDLCLPIGNGAYLSLYIEMKTKGGKVTENQNNWHEALKSAGHKVAVCWSFEEARNVIVEYLGIWG